MTSSDTETSEQNTNELPPSDETTNDENRIETFDPFEVFFSISSHVNV